MIGLLTIFRCTNYGAVLQAIALRRVLAELAPDAGIEVINHWMDPRDNHLLGKITNPNTPWFQRWRNRRKFGKRYLGTELFEERRRKTVSLIEQELAPSEQVFRSPRELGGLRPFDTVVVGSDQVWNPTLNHDFPVNPYLCTEFPENQRRVAYAASFGISELPDECIGQYRDALGRFSAITVREETGAAICESLTGARPEVVLDPTMLLMADAWSGLVSKTRKSSYGAGAFLAAYWVRSVEQRDVDALARIAREKGCVVRLMSAGHLQKLDFPAEVIPCIDADPFDFVRLIEESSGLITDSFHGVQFAVSFRKPLLALGNLSDPKSNASRLVDFCRLVKLPSACAEIEAFRFGVNMSLAGTSECDGEVLSNFRTRSLSVLKSIVQGR